MFRYWFVHNTYVWQFLNTRLVIFFRQISNEIADLRQRIWQWIQVHSSMNAVSKASIRFEAFFFGGEDCNNDTGLSPMATVVYRDVPKEREWPTQSFDIWFENVAERSIYSVHDRTDWKPMTATRNMFSPMSVVLSTTTRPNDGIVRLIDGDNRPELHFFPLAIGQRRNSVREQRMVRTNNNNYNIDIKTQQ